MTIFEIINKLSNGGMDGLFSQIYGKSKDELLRQRARFLNCTENFSRLYPLREDVRIFSVPASLILGGEFAPFQHSCCISAAASADILGFVAYHDEEVVRISSDYFDVIEIDLSDLSDIAEKYKGFAAVAAGIISEFANMGIPCCGFDAYISSDISEISAFDINSALNILICNIINNSVENKLSEIEIAKIGHKFSENHADFLPYFGSAIGGVALFDMKNPHEPQVHKLNFDFSQWGYSLCMVDFGGESSFEKIDKDLKSVAESIGADYLGNIDDEAFFDDISQIRKKCTSRELAHALWFVEENNRCRIEAECLDSGRFTDFLEIFNESGNDTAVMFLSSYSAENEEKFKAAFAVSMSRKYLGGSGAIRLCNGYLLAFVPNFMAKGYAETIDEIMGAGCTKIMGLRKEANGELYV